MTEPEALFKRRFPLIRFDAIQLKTAPSYLVKGLIPRSGLVVIWGPPKCGKSFWAFDVAAHIALGWSYRDRKVQQGAVVYLVLEGEHGIGARVEAWRQQHLRAATAGTSRHSNPREEQDHENPNTALFRRLPRVRYSVLRNSR